VDILLRIDAALNPIVGRRGVAALLQRSLHLSAQTHPWLLPLDAELPMGVDVAPLHKALVRQAPAAAAEGVDHLVHTFHELLASLVGASLSERLLRPVWADLSGGASAQDTSS